MKWEFLPSSLLAGRGLWRAAAWALAFLVWLPLAGHAATVRDNFDAASYAGNNGTANWTTNWFEINEADGPTNGDEQIVADGGSNRLRVKDNNGGGEGVEREADLSGNAFAILSFDYRRNGLDNTNDYVTIEVSGDGGASWTELDRFAGPGTDGAYRSVLYDISAYISGNTRIRFLSSANLGNNDIVYFDNVEIYYQATVPSPPASVGEWRMDEFSWNGTAGEVIDSGANGLNGVAVAGAVPNTGYLCNAASLNGTTQYVEIADNALLDISGELTVTAWIDPNTLPTGGNLKTIVSKDTNYEFHLTSAGEVYWWWNDVNGTARNLTTSGAGITAGTWHHVAIVYSSSTAAQRIYVDGVLRASASFGEALIVNNAPLQIGADQGFAGREFDGLIDEVNVYGAALSQYQVIAAMTATRSCPTPAALAYYAMDEASWNGTGGEVVDSSGNGNNGVAVGGAQTIDPAPTPTPISPGNCRAGATVNEGESIDTGVDIDGALGNTGTVTFWFRPNWSQSGGERNTARVLFDASMGDKYFKLAKLDNTNNLYPSNNARRRLALLFEDSADNDFVAYTTSEPSFSANTWVHIAVTWDFPGDRFQIYLDGVLVADQTINTNGTIAPLDTLYFGDTRSGYNPYGVTTVANGAFDEVRLYNSVLSQSAITADRNAAHACVTVDHYEITYPSGATAVTCESLNVRITAHDASDAAVAVPAGTAMTLNTTTATGVWLSPTVTGTGAWAPSGTNNGQAAYAWPGGESTLEVRLRHNTAVAPIGMNLGGTYSESATEDPAAAFVDSGFRVTDAAGVASVSIGTQIAGKDSNTGLGAQTLFLQAIRTDTGTGSCAGVFPSQTVTVQLASECNNPAACVPTPGSQVRVRNSGALMIPIAQNNNAAVGSYSNVSLAFDPQSKAPLVLNYPDVGQITLHARYALPTPPSTFMIGSSNAFVVKPAGFVISNIIRTSDSFANPAAADATGAAFIHAGDAFTATVSAVAFDGSTVTPNFGRESTPEGVLLSQMLIAPAGGNGGAIGNATVPGSEFGAGGMVNDPNGSATVTNLSWNEVGIIQLSGQVADNNYLGAGAAPNTYASANIGRFTPDHFAVIGAMTLVNRSNLACAGSTFTYLGEPLRLAFQLEARELGGGRVLNYLPSGISADNFAKLDVTAGGAFGVLSGTGALNTNPDTSSRIAVTASGANAWQTGASAGRTNVLAVDVAFARRNDNAVDGAFGGTEIGIAPQDATDNIGLAAAALNRDWVAPAGNDHLLFSTTNLRFGRVALENVFGSELLPLSMGMEAEYYVDANTGFVTNGDDSCTAVGTAQLDLSNNIANPPQGTATITTNSGPPAKSTTVGIDNTPFSAGAGNLTFSAPGTGGDGYADVSVDLSGWSWLRFDWDGNGVNDNDPSARATFGIYEGSPRQIYLRERY